MKIDKNLSQMKIKPLTKEERERVWQYIMTTIHQPVQASRFSFGELFRKPLMVAMVVVFILAGGSVATVYASDSAKPGDILFSIDRAIEEIQLRLASGQHRTELKLGMVQERLEEIQAILAESNVEEEDEEVGEDGGNEDFNNDNENDNEEDEEDDGDNGQDGEDEDGEDGEDENEDDGDEDEEDENEATGNDPIGDRARVEHAFDTALDFIAEIRESLLADGNLEAVAALDAIVGKIDTEIDGLPSRLKLDIKSKKDKHKLTLDIRFSDGRQKLKIKTDNGKIDIEYRDENGKSKLKVKKDGEVRFESEDKKDEDDEDDEDEEDEDKDTVNPVVATFSPADDSINVAADTNLVIIFSENVVAGSSNITIKKASDDSTVEIIDVVSVAGLGTDTITIDPASDLESETGYYVQIDATAFEDESGNAYEGIADDVTWNFTTADVIAPIISLIVSTPSVASSTIIWTTDEDADSAVWYGTSTPVFAQVPFLSVTDATLQTDHSLDLLGLSASTTYNFIVVSKDEAGNESTSEEVSFVTLAP